MDVCFIAFLYGLARLVRGLAWCIGSGVATVVLSTSFEGAYALWDYWRQGGVPLARPGIERGRAVPLGTS
ncbi:MAG: hypothetical protein R2712_29390 [Vicinamibacterales bacterium]